MYSINDKDLDSSIPQLTGIGLTADSLSLSHYHWSQEELREVIIAWSDIDKLSDDTKGGPG